MPIDGKELNRRIVAARELRGISQVALGKLFEGDGLGKYDPARIERGEMTMLRAHREAFAHHLGVPESWFLEEDVDIIVGLKPAEASDVAQRLDTIEQILVGLGEAVTELATDRREADEPPQAARGSSS